MWSNFPSPVRLTDPSTKSDPAVAMILEAYKAKWKREGLEIGTVEYDLELHRVLMKIENLVGDLGERYVQPVLEKRGFRRSAGCIAEGIDFVRLEDDGSYTELQMKNSTTTQNSSSSKPAKGKGIILWCRRCSKNGKTFWHKFPIKTEPGELSEEGFLEFVRKMLPRILPEWE